MEVWEVQNHGRTTNQFDQNMIVVKSTPNIIERLYASSFVCNFCVI
jgi:hypothetical protein